MTERAPGTPLSRSWMLTDWSLRSKVGAVVALPLILAMTFGALRVQASLSEASDLSGAADSVRIVQPALAFDAAVAAMSTIGNPGVDPAKGFTLYDTAVAALQTAMSSTDLGSSSESTLTRLVATAATLRGRIENGGISATERSDASGAITDTVVGLVQSALSVDDAHVRDQTAAIVAATRARRAVSVQQQLISAPNDSTRDQVVEAAGRESSDLDRLAEIVGSTTAAIVEQQTRLDDRLSAYGGVFASLQPNASVAAMLSVSSAQYTDIASQYATKVADTVSSDATSLRSTALRDTAFVLGSVLLALVLALLVARSLVRPIRALRYGALDVARKQLPSEIEEIRSGAPTPRITPIPVHSGEEIGQLARAVDDIHEEALQLAGEQARLRVQIGNMFETLSRRSRSLVDQQLTLIEELERDEDDPRRLDSLFKLDHLAARMRRNGANLMVLAGTSTRRAHLEPVAVSAIVSAAVSEVEDYRRVQIGDAPETLVLGAPAADAVHIVAEIVDNALRYSPPDSPVSISMARAVDGGILLEIADRGLGMPAQDIEAANVRLESGGEVTPETARRMGLFVVSRLARRHGVTVRVRTTFPTVDRPGITVSVHLPADAVASSFEPHKPQPQPSRPAVRQPWTTPLTSAPTAPSTPEPQRERPQRDQTQRDEPQRASGGLPQRRPGASGVLDLTGMFPAVNGSAAIPTTRPSHNGEQPAPTNLSSIDPDHRTGNRHYLSRNGTSPSNTSAYFSARTQRTAPEAGEVDESTPIFRRMMSDWLDPSASERPGGWESAADRGWTAAESATAQPIEQVTESGLPVRRPGARLVPGTAETASSPGGARSPSSIRNNISSHFDGVRNARSRVEGHQSVNGRHRTDQER